MASQIPPQDLELFSRSFTCTVTGMAAGPGSALRCAGQGVAQGTHRVQAEEGLWGKAGALCEDIDGCSQGGSGLPVPHGHRGCVIQAHTQCQWQRPGQYGAELEGKVPSEPWHGWGRGVRNTDITDATKGADLGEG